MSDIVYTLGQNLYLNLTNRCPCACTFCIRQNGAGVGSAGNLWHDSDPSLDEVMKALSGVNLSDYPEVVLCGYGEPMCALDTLVKTCDYLKSHGCRVRLNTNGLADLVHEKPTAHLLKGRVDIVSISLNAPTADKYMKLCAPEFGERSFEAMLAFTRECKLYVPTVILSVVDVIPEEDIAQCRAIAEGMGAE